MSATLPLTLQTGAPVTHDTAPALHGIPEIGHEAPLVQLMQLPLEQTRFMPHPAPLASALPVSTQVGVPPAHERAPAWQGLEGVQGLPASHAMQEPSLQT
jgi:hypothetical protein